MSLDAAAKKAAPFFGGVLDKANPEEHLINAFYAARSALFGALPRGASFDSKQAILASDITRQQIEAKQSVIVPRLEAGADIPMPDAISLNSDQSRQYYIAKYIEASKGLGAYPAGIGRNAVDAGIITQQDYFDGIEARIRLYSDIIEAGNTGQIHGLVNAEQFGSSVVVDSAGVKPLGAASGFGELATGTLILIGIVAVALVGAAAYVITQRHSIDRTTSMMSENCREAVRLNNEQAIKYCSEFAKETVSGGGVKSLVGAGGQEQLLKYLAYAGGAYLLVVMLPTITSSLFSTQEVVRQRRSR